MGGVLALHAHHALLLQRVHPKLLDVYPPSKKHGPKESKPISHKTRVSTSLQSKGKHNQLLLLLVDHVKRADHVTCVPIGMTICNGLAATASCSDGKQLWGH